jgi:hypothetical protein
MNLVLLAANAAVQIEVFPPRSTYLLVLKAWSEW